MDCVVLIPGITGSVLQTSDGTEVWPPTPKEVVFGYKRIAEIMRDDVTSTDIIRKVSCVDVYKPLIEQIEDLGFTVDGSDQRLSIFHYDWRLDLEKLAKNLSAHLEHLVADGAETITLVAHSMGGLVARLTVEPVTYRSTSWYSKIKGVFTLGTPHLGAPMTLIRILGLEGSQGVSAKDFKTFTNDDRFPSAYQVLPAPGEDAVWKIDDPRIKPFDIYNPTDAKRVGLNPRLVARATWVHETLASGERPPQARYFSFAAGGHKTCTRLDVDHATASPTLTRDGGDGTVPMWSAFGHVTQKHLVMGEHAKFFRRYEFKEVFYRLFGKTLSMPSRFADGMIDLSVQALVLHPEEEIELLILSSRPTTSVRGAVSLAFTEDENVAFASMGEPVDVSYEGPPLTQLMVTLPATGKPGHYQVSFAGKPAADEPVLFSVTTEQA